MTRSLSEETDYIRSRLKHYAERGTFSGVRELPIRGNKHAFNFQWLLGAEFSLLWDPSRRELLFENLLPKLSYPSFLDREIRRFTHERSTSELPEHRRVDPGKASVRYSNRKGDGQIAVKLSNGDAVYGLKAALTFVNDLFAWLHMYHIDYLHREFGVPEE
ncbi:MAG: hypothetical protein GKR90_00330 [Pseudomonadales bacterium]|nr:hypothetical protein [Pseudomonadales bacterium]